MKRWTITGFPNARKSGDGPFVARWTICTPSRPSQVAQVLITGFELEKGMESGRRIYLATSLVSHRGSNGYGRSLSNVRASRTGGNRFFWEVPIHTMIARGSIVDNDT